MEWIQLVAFVAVAAVSVGLTVLIMRGRARRTEATAPTKDDGASHESGPSSTSGVRAVIDVTPPPPPLASELLIGSSSHAPAVTLRPLANEAAFRNARTIAQPEAIRGRLNAMMQAVPGVLIAEQQAGRHLMEVVINGDLVRAADGVGYRAMAHGVDGISGHARLFDATTFTSLVSAAAVWQVASVIVAQKHLADISARLQVIQRSIDRLSTFLDSERRSRLNGTFAYPGQLYEGLKDGRLPAQSIVQLEAAEVDLLSIYDHLRSEFDREVEAEPADGDTFGTEDLTKESVAKVARLEALAADIRLCLQVRTSAWYLSAILPDVNGLQQARRASIENAIGELRSLGESVVRATERDVSRIKSFWNKGTTLQARRQQVLEAAQTMRRQVEGHATFSTGDLQEMKRALHESGKPMKLLLAVEDGRVIETRLA